MFVPFTPEFYLAHSVTAESIADRHDRKGDTALARAWRGKARRFRSTAMRLAGRTL